MLDISAGIVFQNEFYAPPGPLKIYASNVFGLAVFGLFDSSTLVPADLQDIVVLALASSDTAWSTTSVSGLPQLSVLQLGVPCVNNRPRSYLTSVSLSDLPSIATSPYLMGDTSGGVGLEYNLLTQAAAEAVAGDLIVNDISGGYLAILNQYDISGNTYTPVTLDISGTLLTLQNQYGWTLEPPVL